MNSFFTLHASPEEMVNPIEEPLYISEVVENFMVGSPLGKEGRDYCRMDLELMIRSEARKYRIRIFRCLILSLGDRRWRGAGGLW